MVIGHHLIWTAYGWWLPNDPRGSSSHEIRVEKLKSLGDLHYGRKIAQPSAPEMQTFQVAAEELLAHQVLLFDDYHIAIIGRAIGETIQTAGYTCYACAVMPEHVHLLIRRHKDWAETMLEKFQMATRQALVEKGRRHPMHPTWGGNGWKVFQSTPEQMARTIIYIQENPTKAGRPAQEWDFVSPYGNWQPRPARRR